MFGSRSLAGWWVYTKYVASYRFFRIVHGLLPSLHHWQFREAPECGCCGGNEMRCYRCWLCVEIPDEVFRCRCWQCKVHNGNEV